MSAVGATPVELRSPRVDWYPCPFATPGPSGPCASKEVSALRAYDVLMIVDPRLTEEEVAQLSTRLQESLTALGGSVESVDNWGKRRLAFEIRKQREGQYLLFQVQAEPASMREYERQLRLNESVCRFMTTRVPERRLRARSVQAPPEGDTAAEPVVPIPDEVG